MKDRCVQIIGLPLTDRTDSWLSDCDAFAKPGRGQQGMRIFQCTVGHAIGIALSSLCERGDPSGNDLLEGIFGLVMRRAARAISNAIPITRLVSRSGS